jgi:hypothetical protein
VFNASWAKLGSMTIFRIGSGAGYAGDRIDPAQDLAQRGQLNALVFECLAERTIALAQLRRSHDPNAGFDPLLPERMRAVLPACVANGTTVITNMGAANPLAAGQAVLAVAHELGLPHLTVAVVTGDDVLSWVLANDVPLIDSNQTTSDMRQSLISANVYLGADALLPALQAGAHVIITGRVADPALFLAPLMHHFGWHADDWPRLGAGLLVGHLLECAAQVTGGYIADPGHFDVPDLHRVGFPLAEVAADGTAVITKLPGTGGRVDRLTCSAQLLYEVEDPARYLQPDVVGDFSGVQFAVAAATGAPAAPVEPTVAATPARPAAHPLGGATGPTSGPDRVAVSGASGHPRPDQLKVTLGYRDGFVGEGQISYAGPGARARGELALSILEHRLVVAGLAELDHRAELLGVNAMHGPHLGADREPYEVRVRLAVRCATRAQAERVGQEVEALYLNGPAGGGGVTQSVREVVAAASALMPRSAVQPQCQVFEHRLADAGATAGAIDIASPKTNSGVGVGVCSWGGAGSTGRPAAGPVSATTAAGIPVALSQPPANAAHTQPPARLQDIAIARSGDKGNRATLSVIARDPSHFPVLDRLLTAERVKAHYRGVVHGEVQRHALPHLGAVHFVMHDALGGGVTRSLALDAHGKTLSAAILDLPLPGTDAIT